MNWNLVGSIYGRSSLKSAHFVIIHYQTWPSRLKCEKLTDDTQQTTDAKWCQKLTLPLARWAKKNIKMWIPKCTSRSVNKHGHHRQFLFLIGQYLKKSSSLKLLVSSGQQLRLSKVHDFYTVIIILFQFGLVVSWWPYGWVMLRFMNCTLQLVDCTYVGWYYVLVQYSHITSFFRFINSHWLFSDWKTFMT
jgi:hypothetical protein